MFALILLAFFVLLCFAAAVSSMSSQQQRDNTEKKPPQIDITDPDDNNDGKNIDERTSRAMIQHNRRYDESTSGILVEPVKKEENSTIVRTSSNTDDSILNEKSYDLPRNETSVPLSPKHQNNEDPEDDDIDPLKGFHWRMFPVGSFDPKHDIDARRIARTAKRFISLSTRQTASNFDRVRSSESDSITPTVTPQSSKREGNNSIPVTLVHGDVATTFFGHDWDGDGDDSTLNDVAYYYDVEPTEEILSRSTRNVQTITAKVSTTVRRLDRETRLLNHLWYVYASKCNGKFAIHAQKCSYAARLGETKELAYHVRLALVNLLDADEPERLLQLGCILLLRATNQFAEELAPVFESLINDYVVCTRLREIDEMCKKLLASKDFDAIARASTNPDRLVGAIVPRIRSSEKEKQSLNDAQRPLYMRVSRNYIGTTTERRQYVSIGESQHLNRVCGYNGVCIDTMDSRRITNDTLSKIDDACIRYVRHVWTERSKPSAIVQHAILDDGSLLTYVDNLDGNTDVNVPLQRVSARNIILRNTSQQPVTNDVRQANMRSYIGSYNFDFAKRYTTDESYDVLFMSKEPKYDETASTVRVEYNNLGNYDNVSQCYEINATVSAGVRALFVTRKGIKVQQHSQAVISYMETLNDAKSIDAVVRYLPGPTYSETWLRVSDPIPVPNSYIKVVISGKCHVPFAGWFRKPGSDASHIGMRRVFVTK